MKKRTSATTRIFAALALAAAIVAVIVVVPAALKDDSSDSPHRGSSHQANSKPVKPRTKAKTYEVESGDTLLSISHRTGVSIAEIQALNPEVDPQILTVGETLKLR